MKRLDIKLDQDGILTVRRMFTSRVDRGGSRGGIEDYGLIAGAIDRGYLLVDEEPFGAVTDVDSFNIDPTHQFYDFWFYAQSAGGVGHSRLKFEAAAILHRTGERNVRFEYRCPIGIADVFGEDSQTLIECGNTDPAKVFATLAERDFPTFWLMPFPNGRYAGEPIFGDVVWKFTMTETGFEWWAEHKEARIEAMRESVDRRPINPALEW